MKTRYRLFSIIILLAFLSGGSIGHEVLTDISDRRNQYDKHEMPNKKQSFYSYTAEREKRIREERLTEEQRVKSANREIPSVYAEEYNEITEDLRR